MVKKINDYVMSAYKELRKVVWPTREEVIRHTVLVIALSLAFAIFLGGVDYLLTIALETII
jgi:preprotein translocase subunit SecE